MTKNIQIHIIIVVFVSIFGCSKNKKITLAASRMQDFVIQIARSARAAKPDFLVIPQNGVELVYVEADRESGFHEQYLQSIDAVGIEELFYNGTLKPDYERLAIAQEIKQQGKEVLVSEYVKENSLVQEAYARNKMHGFLCYVRTKDNYYYNQLPAQIYEEHNQPVMTLFDARNFLYFLNYEKFSSKQQLLELLAATNYDILLIDLFYNQQMWTADEIRMLKTKANGSKRLVICYMNIGSAETYRYYWQKHWKRENPSWIKKSYKGYEDEYWVEFWHPQWQDIIYKSEDSYLNRILRADFDGVYLDNVEAYYFLYH